MMSVKIDSKWFFETFCSLSTSEFNVETTDNSRFLSVVEIRLIMRASTPNRSSSDKVNHETPLFYAAIEVCTYMHSYKNQFTCTYGANLRVHMDFSARACVKEIISFITLGKTSLTFLMTCTMFETFLVGWTRSRLQIMNLETHLYRYSSFRKVPTVQITAGHVPQSRSQSRPQSFMKDRTS
jgi:hypothetical protein